MPKCILVTREETFEMTNNQKYVRAELWHPHRQLTLKSQTFEGTIRLCLNGIDITDRDVILHSGETGIVTLENVPMGSWCTPVVSFPKTFNEVCYSEEVLRLPVDVRENVFDFSRIDSVKLITDEGIGSFTLESQFYTWINDTADLSQIDDARVFLDPRGISGIKTAEYVQEFDYISSTKEDEKKNSSATENPGWFSKEDRMTYTLEERFASC